MLPSLERGSHHLTSCAPGWVRGPVNLAGRLEILAKVWLHKILEKGIPVPSKLAQLRTLLSESGEDDLPPCSFSSVSPHISLQIIAPAAAMVNNFFETAQNTNKTQLLASN